MLSIRCLTHTSHHHICYSTCYHTGWVTHCMETSSASCTDTVVWAQKTIVNAQVPSTHADKHTRNEIWGHFLVVKVTEMVVHFNVVFRGPNSSTSIRTPVLSRSSSDCRWGNHLASLSASLAAARARMESMLIIFHHGSSHDPLHSTALAQCLWVQLQQPINFNMISADLA